jgi:hypothetical protein
VNKKKAQIVSAPNVSASRVNVALKPRAANAAADRAYKEL